MTDEIVPQTKRCSKCRRDLPATPEFFHRHNRRNRQELYPQCKTCKNEYARTPAGKEVIKRKTHNWRQTEKGKDFLRAKENRKKDRYPEKYAARAAVQNAVKRNALLKIADCDCSWCNEQAQAYHHWSYKQEHWLDVIPLCRSCHDKIHRMNKVARLKLETRLLETSKAA